MTSSTLVLSLLGQESNAASSNDDSVLKSIPKYTLAARMESALQNVIKQTVNTMLV